MEIFDISTNFSFSVFRKRQNIVSLHVSKGSFFPLFFFFFFYADKLRMRIIFFFRGGGGGGGGGKDLKGDEESFFFSNGESRLDEIVKSKPASLSEYLSFLDGHL